MYSRDQAERKEEAHASVGAEAVWAEVERVLSSRAFAHSERLHGLLRFLIEKALLGGQELNEYAIAVDYLAKDPSFDPRIDPIVRVTTRRLRAKLAIYYKTEGTGDKVIIEIPPRSYDPAVRRREHGAADPAARPAGKSIAVEPFVSLSPHAQDRFYADGLTSELVHALSKLPDMKVLLCAKPKPDQDGSGGLTGRRDVDAVFAGTVRILGNRARVSAQLLNSGDGMVLWSEMYDGDVSQALGSQQRISFSICRELRVRLGPERDERVGKADGAAAGGFSEDRFRGDGGKRAAALRPQLAVSEAGSEDGKSAVAECLLLLATRGELAPQELTRTRESAVHALAVDARLPEPHVCLGAAAAILDWDFAASEREFREALALSPESPMAAEWYSRCVLAPTGQTDAAIALLERAWYREPFSANIADSLAYVLCGAGRREEAQRVVGVALELTPDNASLNWTAGLLALASRQHGDAIARFERAQQFGANYFAAAALAHAFGMAGRDEQAREIVTELERARARWYVPAFDMTVAYLGLRRMSDALDWLDQAKDERCPSLILRIIDPMLTPLHADKRFRAIVASIGLSVSGAK